MRLLVPTFVGTALFFVWVYAIFDIVATEPMLARNLPKGTWLFLVILVPGVGAIAWLALGRPMNAGWYPGDTAVRKRRTVVGPEDREDWAPRRPREEPPPRRQSQPSSDHPAAEPKSSASEPSESSAARERRLMEWEAELARREADLGDDEATD